MVAKTPRMTAGTTALTATEISMRYELEIESSLATSLAGLISDIPVATDDDNLFSASLALKVGQLRSFLLEKANAIVASPYQCEELQQLNHQAEQLVAQLNIPMPPMVNNLMGLRVKVNEFDPTADMPQGDGLLALYVDKPEMFVGMATMMVPGFDALDLANQTEPVRIPTEVLHVENLDVFALMSDNAIGAAIGQQHASGLKPFLNEKAQGTGTFMSVSYDMAKQLELQTAMSGKLDFNYGNNHSKADEFSEAMKASYVNMLGRSRVEMRFSADGMVIDSKITFK